MKYFCDSALDSASNSKDSGVLQFSTSTSTHSGTWPYRVLSSTRSPGSKLECTSVAQKLVALRMASKSSPTPGSSSPYAVPQLQLTPQSPFPALEPTNPAPTLSRQEQQRQEQNYAAAYISARAAHQFDRLRVVVCFERGVVQQVPGPSRISISIAVNRGSADPMEQCSQTAQRLRSFGAATQQQTSTALFY